MFDRKTDYFVFDSLADARAAFTRLYTSGRRLPNRIYRDQDRYVFSGSEGLPISERLIRAISHHISSALKAGYADLIFYPDMGHVHVLAPIDEPNAGLEHPGNKYLYHTAELLKLKQGSLFTGRLVDDEWLQWRYRSRNFVGSLNTEETVSLVSSPGGYNTVRGLDGYQELATLYISSSAHGCFSYEFGDEILWFDIGL